MCFCIGASAEKKQFLEGTFKLITLMKKNKNIYLLKTLLTTFTDVSKYLDVEFKKQDQTISNSGATLSSDSPLSKFITDNTLLPINLFYPKYTEFIINHLSEKYKKEFGRLKIFNIPKMLKNGFDFISCINDRSYKQGTFVSKSDVTKLVNSKMSDLFKSIIEAVERE